MLNFRIGDRTKRTLNQVIKMTSRPNVPAMTNTHIGHRVAVVTVSIRVSFIVLIHNQARLSLCLQGFSGGRMRQFLFFKRYLKWTWSSL